MNAYIYTAALLCEDCAAAVMQELGPVNGREDSDDYPQGPYSNGGGEADSPSHCDSCHVFLENPLTTDGMAYVREEIVANRKAGFRDLKSVVTTQWAPYYGIPLEEEEEQEEEGDCFDAARHADHGER